MSGRAAVGTHCPSCCSSLGAVVLSFAFRPDRNVAGTPAAGEAATTISTTTPDPAPGGPTITVPSTTSPSFSFPDPGTTPGPPPEVEPDGAMGAETGGDPYYPDAGNGGYDVTGLRGVADLRPGRPVVCRPTTVIDATVTEATRLGRFSFDLQPTMTVSEVPSTDTAAGFDQHDAKLTVTPVTGLDPGTAATVAVTYRGTPAPIIGGTSGLADGGWYNLDSGGRRGHRRTVLGLRLVSGQRDPHRPRHFPRRPHRSRPAGR